jgi:hypothetical protein
MMGVILVLALDRSMLLATILLICLWAVLIELGAATLEWLS